MLPPDWRMTVATDGKTEVRTLLAEDGTLSIRLSSGAVSIVAAIPAELLPFILWNAVRAGAAA